MARNRCGRDAATTDHGQSQTPSCPSTHTVVDTANGPYTLFATSVVSAFRCIPRGSASGDVDLVALVRRSWYGALKRNAGGSPHTVTFRFPRLAVGGRMHPSVSCTVNRSGYVLVMSSTFVHDAPALMQFIHAFLAPHVCALGAAAELELSMASQAPLDMSLLHFNAVLRPVAVSTDDGGGDGDATGGRRRNAMSLRLRLLKALVEQWWPATGNSDAPGSAATLRSEDDGAGEGRTKRERSPSAHVNTAATAAPIEALSSMSTNWADVFSFSSVAPYRGGTMHDWTESLTNPPQSVIGGVISNVSQQHPLLHAPSPTAPGTVLSTTEVRDVDADLRSVCGQCVVTVLPTRSDQTEIRLQVTRRPVADHGGGGNGGPSTSVTLLVKHTGTLFVTKAASMGDVAWAMQHAVGALLKRASD